MNAALPRQSDLAGLRIRRSVETFVVVTILHHRQTDQSLFLHKFSNFAEPLDKFLKLLLAHIKLAAIGNKLSKLKMMFAQNSIEVTGTQ